MFFALWGPVFELPQWLPTDKFDIFQRLLFYISKFTKQGKLFGHVQKQCAEFSHLKNGQYQKNEDKTILL